ncbi:MAG: zinc-ribbon domain-containing protein [Methanomassiliicoccales archaeon]|nr:zinc-ribbon domain-containing protein [Methanomassiliicoccales archaeon]
MDELRNEPILLAHHPLCGRFDDHLLTIRGRKVCRSCGTAYEPGAQFCPKCGNRL